MNLAGALNGKTLRPLPPLKQAFPGAWPRTHGQRHDFGNSGFDFMDTIKPLTTTTDMAEQSWYQSRIATEGRADAFVRKQASNAMQEASLPGSAGP